MVTLAQSVCKVCNVGKSLSDFPSRLKGGCAYRLKVCRLCHKEKERLRSRRYRAKHREAINRRARIDKLIRYETDPEFREKLKAQSRKYYSNQLLKTAT